MHRKEFGPSMEPASGPFRLLSVHAGHSTFFSASIDSLFIGHSFFITDNKPKLSL